MVYEPKKQPCPLCKGAKKIQMKRAVFILGGPKEVSEETKEIAEGFASDDNCPHCNGVGYTHLPPYSDGAKAQISEEKIRELAKAATLLRCIDHPIFIQAVANQAARIQLPDEMVTTYAGYWADPYRDVTLGEYISQIAQSAEEHAIATYGDLGNPIYAGPRPASK